MTEERCEEDAASTESDKLKDFVRAAVKEAFTESQGKATQPPKQSIWVVIIGQSPIRRSSSRWSRSLQL